MKCVPLPLRKRRKNMLNLYSMNLFLLLLSFFIPQQGFFYLSICFSNIRESQFF